MADRYGYWNKILHVDLTKRSFSVEEPGDAFYRRYIGGRGFIAHPHHPFLAAVDGIAVVMKTA